MSKLVYSFVLGVALTLSAVYFFPAASATPSPAPTPSCKPAPSDDDEPDPRAVNSKLDALEREIQSDAGK